MVRVKNTYMNIYLYYLKNTVIVPVRMVGRTDLFGDGHIIWDHTTNHIYLNLMYTHMISRFFACNARSLLHWSYFVWHLQYAFCKTSISFIIHVNTSCILCCRKEHI